MSNSKVVHTDGEPDDVLYLALAGACTDVVVGVGDTAAKSRRLQAAFPNANVTRGSASDHHFVERGCFSGLPLLPSADVGKRYDTFVVLKPPVELMAYAAAHPAAAAALFGCATLYMYGSYNFRCLMKRFGTPAILAFIGMFRQAFIYESFFASPDGNSLNAAVGGEDLIDAIRALPGMADLMDDWDENMLQDCLNTCNGLAPGRAPGPLPADTTLTDRQIAKYNRNGKTFCSIKENQGRQLVCGDFCIALLDDSDYEPVELTFDAVRGYTQCKPSPGSRVHMVKKIGLLEIVARLRARLIQ
jgi:hypothetical protein